MKSVLQQENECYICGTTENLHTHHCIYGTANRKKSERYGLTVKLCFKHHNGSSEGVHFNKELDLHLKSLAQKYFEENTGNRKQFIQEFGKSYL